ncbi:33628_t:CDS:2, partial [Racocetra persica]
NLWQIHRNPNLWNDADKFIPERFMDPEKEAKSNWVPFSGGPRNCLGQNFSMMEQKIIIAMMLLKFKVSLPPNSQHFDKILLATSAIIRPKNLELIFS